MEWPLFFRMMTMMLLIHILSGSRMKLAMRVMKRMRILLLTRMMEGLPVVTLGRKNQMLVKVGEREKPVKKESKREASSKTLPKKKSRDGEESSKSKMPKKKKDPNAPKKAMNGYVFFSQVERQNVKKNNPGIAFGEIARAIGDKWKSMNAEEKEPYQAMARADKKRYKEEVGGYKNPQPMNIDWGNESDSP